jgi:K+ transporter
MKVIAREVHTALIRSNAAPDVIRAAKRAESSSGVKGALILAEPSAVSNPFFLLFQDWLLLPAVMLSTVATVIASQAVISGAFALVQQAIQLGALPRLDVRQTSDESIGQVYVPQVNWLLAAAVLALVFGFRSSDALANAYGIAVAGDMLVTTLLVFVLAVFAPSLVLAWLAAVAGRQGVHEQVAVVLVFLPPIATRDQLRRLGATW